MSVREAATALGVGLHSVYAAIRSGKLRALRVGSKPRFRVPREAIAEALSDPSTFEKEAAR
jgi:excisionase family DNA binding protein